jgi:hypothetical protein
MDNAQIKAKVAARAAADTVWQLAMDEATGHENEACLAFYRRLLEHLCTVLPPECLPTRIVERGPLAAMTNDEAAKFESELVPFGKWANKLVCEVPLSYFDWLIGEQNFQTRAERYMRNDRVQAEQANERL